MRVQSRHRDELAVLLGMYLAGEFYVQSALLRLLRTSRCARELTSWALHPEDGDAIAFLLSELGARAPQDAHIAKAIRVGARRVRYYCMDMVQAAGGWHSECLRATVRCLDDSDRVIREKAREVVASVRAGLPRKRTRRTTRSKRG